MIQKIYKVRCKNEAKVNRQKFEAKNNKKDAKMMQKLRCKIMKHKIIKMRCKKQ